MSGHLPAPGVVARAGATVQRSAHCPVCAGADLQDVLETVRPVPVFCNWLYDDAASALAATTGQVRLVACRGCGHVFNSEHDEALMAYGAGYENSLHFSSTFQEYAVALAARLVTQHGLHGGTALEVGSGKGDFLALLVEKGLGRGVGYDPSYDGEQDRQVGGGLVTFVRALFPERLADLDVDLVCARHVLEHLERPTALVDTLRPAFGEGTKAVLYAEVPDGGYLLRETALWDLIYEHPSHFTAASLHRLLAGGGLPVTALGTSFGGQYLWAEATARPQHDAVPRPGVTEVLEAAEGFGQRAVTTVDHWADELARAATAGRRVALWGAGSKGVSFLNMVPGAQDVDAVVDVNPRKHGRHVPGTGQQVVPPSALAASPPDDVVVLNPLYVSEVRAELASLGVTAVVRAAWTGGLPAR